MKVNYHELIVENFSFEERLNLLQDYLVKKIDNNGILEKGWTPFEQWAVCTRSWLIKDTKAHAKKYSTHCYYCRKEFNEFRPGCEKTLDHFQPKSGRAITTKYVVCCKKCNGLKGQMNVKTFRKILKNRYFQGGNVLELTGESLKFLIKQVSKIFTDIDFNTGPKYYFLNLHHNKKKQHERIRKETTRSSPVYSKGST